MSAPSTLDDLYWRELAAALHAMVAPGVMLAAACGAALTLTGAATRGVTPVAASCQACQMRLHAPQPAQTPPL